MSHKILVVDDDILVLQALEELLQSSGYDVKTAHRGWEAMDILAKEHFDLLILDVVMPKMTGFDVCRAIRERDDEMSRVKIIMLTAKTSSRDSEQEKLCGCDMYLTKPIDPQKLKNIITQLLEGRKT